MYVQGSAEDLDELWALLRKPQSIVAIWCDGLAGEADMAIVPAATRSRGKRKKQAEAPEVANKKHVDTHERVQTLVD